jgi:hypothetical protein
MIAIPQRTIKARSEDQIASQHFEMQFEMQSVNFVL